MPAAAAKARAAQLTSFPAPTAGWISNRNLAAAPNGQGAAVLDNFFPKASTVILRRGNQQYATVAGGNIGTLFTYDSGHAQRLFAATDTAIYDITSVSGPTDTGTRMGGAYTSSRWSVTQFATAGGVYLIGCNGVDTPFLYDGTTWSALNVVPPAGLPTITAKSLRYVWSYKNRLWFASVNQLDAWYLDTAGTIGGNLVWFPLGGDFAEGGTLLFGASWSSDTSEAGGISEQLVFITDAGEVAVWQGTDASADFNKVGTYQIGRPLGANAFSRGGGDIAIATSVGLVPLSKAITLQVTALSVATISYNIADAWSDAIGQRGDTDWQCQLWPDQKMLVVAPPNLVGGAGPVMFVANTETGAWARYTGWLGLALAVFGGQLYFGGLAGGVFVGNVSGEDNGTLYTGVIVPMFVDLGAPAGIKIGRTARGVVRAAAPVASSITMLAEYSTTLPPAPNAGIGSGDTDLWGVGVWDTSIWGAAAGSTVTQQVVSIGGTGYAVSLGFQVSSWSLGANDPELIRLEMTYETADFLS
jgi:hypothetical protein